MTVREFLRFHLFKALLALIALQMVIFFIIQNFNHKPIAIRDEAKVIEERTLKIAPLLNDMDKDDNEELSVINVFTPLNGKVEQDKNLLYYTPNIGFTGVDSFAYTITDGDKESQKGFVVITVNKNLEPIGEKDSVEVYVGGFISMDVLGNDEDREDDSIFIKEITKPIYGKAKLHDNKIVYVTSNSSSQPDSFYYIISDGRSNSEKIPVYINVKSKSAPCCPWFSSDIGNYSIPGSIKCINNSIIVEASGRDIWGNNDGFRFVYQLVNGDCEMITKVDSLIASHNWAKATLMVRESLSAGSKASVLVLSKNNGATTHHRFATGERMERSDKLPEGKAPYWLKLIRKGDTFTYYISAYGIKWEKIYSVNNPMAKDVYIGFGFTSHNNNELGKVVFSNFRLIAKNLNYQFMEN